MSSMDSLPSTPGELAALRAKNLARRLAQRAAAVRDRDQRVATVISFLEPLSDPDLLGVLESLLSRGQQGDSLARRLSQELALEGVLQEQLPSWRVQDLLGACADRRELSLLFFPRGGPPPEESLAQNPSLILPLGVRRQAARTRDRLLLDRLLRDQDAEVIRRVLTNPILVERDVILIASLRPTRAEVLEEVAESRRWSPRYRVRKALACNPHARVELRRALLPGLLHQDLRFLRGSQVITGALREDLDRLLGGSAEPAEAAPQTRAEAEQLLETWELPLQEEADEARVLAPEDLRRPIPELQAQEQEQEQDLDGAVDALLAQWSEADPSVALAQEELDQLQTAEPAPVSDAAESEDSAAEDPSSEAALVEALIERYAEEGLREVGTED